MSRLPRSQLVVAADVQNKYNTERIETQTGIFPPTSSWNIHSVWIGHRNLSLTLCVCLNLEWRGDLYSPPFFSEHNLLAVSQ